MLRDKAADGKMKKMPTQARLFLIPISCDKYIVAQVGRGDDLGVFNLVSDGQSIPDVTDAHLLFRVDYGRKSPKRFGWIDAGNSQQHSDLQDFAIYGHHAIGDPVYFAVSHEPREVEISKEEYDRLEPLATWSHEHIVNRFMRESDCGLR
jgi:hypothetical protein